MEDQQKGRAVKAIQKYKRLKNEQKESIRAEVLERLAAVEDQLEILDKLVADYKKLST